jgi:hypothetical protein
VDFQVDFVDDEFGLLLAKLVDAVDDCDNALLGMAKKKRKEKGKESTTKGRRKKKKN